ncbi:MAG: hypothetical protein HQL54_00550 [Magnetococcales bacterium]|nr:hypothetical protein [Magnetococcales bacterium]
MKKSTITVLLLTFTLIVVGMELLVFNLFKDKQQILIADKAVPIYKGWLEETDKIKIGQLEAGVQVPVVKIRYGKEYMALPQGFMVIQIQMDEEKTGWVFYEDGLKMLNAEK